MKLEYDEPLSNFAFNFNLRRYAKGGDADMTFRGQDHFEDMVVGPLPD